MSEQKFYFFEYKHDERDFFYIELVSEDLLDVVSSDPSTIPDKLSEMGIDSLLILDYNTQIWFLAYSNSLGIVGERTSRRQADSIRRSGITLPDGYWLKETKFKLEEINDPNLGDLWKTVQNKYLTGDLSGLELDKETGIPKQIKERADRLKSAGHEDALTDAKQEYAEAENRKKAISRSKEITMDAFLSKPKKKTKKAPTKKKLEKVKPASSKEKLATKTKPAAKEKPATKTKLSTKSKTAKKEKVVEEKEKVVTQKPQKPVLFNIDTIIEYVTEGNTAYICRGNITVGKKKPKKITVSLTQSFLTMKEWVDVALFLQEGDSVNIMYEKQAEINYVTSLK